MFMEFLGINHPLVKQQEQECKKNKDRQGPFFIFIIWKKEEEDQKK